MILRPFSIHYSTDAQGDLVVHLHGRDADGDRRHIRVYDTEPHFYVPADAPDPDHAKVKRIEPTALVDLGGQPVKRIVVYHPKDVPGVREGCETTFEADVYYRDRVRYDLGIRDCVTVPDDKSMLDPEDVHPAEPDDPPEPRVCCIDIETSDKSGFSEPDSPTAPVLCVTVWDSRTGMYATFYHGRLSDDTVTDAMARAHERGWQVGLYDTASERELFDHLAEWFATVQPDIVVGWNVRDFDVEYLSNRAAALGYAQPDWRSIVVFDLMEAYEHQHKVAHGELESSALDYVATQKEGLEGKTTHERVWRLYEDDPAALIEYNIQDVALTKDIMERQNLVGFFLDITSFCGTGLENAHRETALADAYMFHRLHGKRVLNSYVHVAKEGKYDGADVLDPKPGIYRNVIEIDNAAEYANIVRTFNISPETRRRDGDGDVVLPTGGAYSTDRRGLFPEVVDELLERRYALKAAGERDKERVVKSVLLSLSYGVTGSEWSRFYDRQMAEDITGMAARHLRFNADVAQELGHGVLYGDTDACYTVPAGIDLDYGQTETEAQRLVQTINERLPKWAAEFGATDCTLEVELERIYDGMLVSSRKKRYAAVYRDPEGAIEHDGRRYALKVRGFEKRRSDASALAKELQVEAFKAALLGDGRPAVVRLVRDAISQVRDGAIDWRKCKIPKRLTKNFSAYKTATEHVHAAKWSNTYLGYDWKRGDKPHLLHGHVEGYPHTHVLAVDWDESAPDGFVPDTDKIIARCILSPMRRILEALGITEDEVMDRTEDTEAWL